MTRKFCCAGALPTRQPGDPAHPKRGRRRFQPRLRKRRGFTLGRLIDPLEADGLVTRTHAADDRRAHVLALTAKARPIVEYIYVLTRNIYDDLLLGISKAEDRQGVRGSMIDVPSGLPTASKRTVAFDQGATPTGAPSSACLRLRRVRPWS
jgi:hypothetical protein